MLSLDKEGSIGEPVDFPGILKNKKYFRRQESRWELFQFVLLF